MIAMSSSIDTELKKKADSLYRQARLYHNRPSTLRQEAAKVLCKTFQPVCVDQVLTIVWNEPLPPKNTGEKEEDISECSEFLSSKDSKISKHSNTGVISEIIGKTIPRHADDIKSKVFNLARGFKYDCKLSEKPLEEIKPLFRQWYTLALLVVPDLDFDLIWCDFISAWETARHPLSVDVVQSAFEKVKGGELPSIAQRFKNENVKWLVGICYELAQSNPKRRFFLSSYKVAILFSMYQPNVYNMFKMLEKEGILKTYKAGNRQRANRYEWIT